MQAEVRYLPHHRREGGTLENIAGERPNAAKTTAPQRIFVQINSITQPRVYEGSFSFNGGSRGHHAATCRSKWQLGTKSSTSSSTSSISSSCSSASSTSFLAAFWATSPITRFRSNQRGGEEVIWAKPQENWLPRVLKTLSINDRQGEPTQGDIGSLISPCSLEKMANPP